MNCPICYGDGMELGRLGARVHLRCRQCGMDYSHHEKNMKTTRIEKLPKAIHDGDWHDKPLKWAVFGPGAEQQNFATKADAKVYARCRRMAGTQFEAHRWAHLQDW